VSHDDTFVGGEDRIRYSVPLSADRGWNRIEVELKFQSIGYRWAHNLERYNSSETSAFVELFRSMEQNTAETVASSILSR
jgi:hypothetical protein